MFRQKNMLFANIFLFFYNIFVDFRILSQYTKNNLMNGIKFAN